LIYLLLSLSIFPLSGGDDGWNQDYFDVIDTPMDFGTICNHLENGTKYKNSENVFKDVQCIWKNCYNYYNEGNFVLDLMKRVEAKFMTYWTAAGLSSKEPGTSSSKGFTLLLFCYFILIGVLNKLVILGDKCSLGSQLYQDFDHQYRYRG